MADPYEQTGRSIKADPEQRLNPPEQDPAEVRRNNILGYLEEALGALRYLEEALSFLSLTDKAAFYQWLEKVNQEERVSRITALKWLRMDLEEWRDEDETD